MHCEISYYQPSVFDWKIGLQTMVCIQTCSMNQMWLNHIHRLYHQYSININTFWLLSRHYQFHGYWSSWAEWNQHYHKSANFKKNLKKRKLSSFEEGTIWWIPQFKCHQLSSTNTNNWFMSKFWNVRPWFFWLSIGQILYV